MRQFALQVESSPLRFASYFICSTASFIFSNWRPIIGSIGSGYLYHSFIRPLITDNVDNLVKFVNQPQDSDKDSQGYVATFLKDHEVAVTAAGEITNEVLVPLLDLYVYKEIATFAVPAVFNMHALNKWLLNPYVLHISPFVFRGASIAIDFKDQCTEELTTIKEFPIRASEFTAWYYFFNFYTSKVLPKNPVLGLTNKLLGIYAIRFLDRMEYKFLENQNISLIDTEFVILPLTKNPVTTVCKLGVDLMVTPLLVLPLEVPCNLLGELSYNHVENRLKHNISLFNFSETLDILSPKFRYLACKALWKTLHQYNEKVITSPNYLDKPAGYRVAAFFHPRSYLTTKLKDYFKTKDSSDLLDPNIVELSDIFGVHGIPLQTTTVQFLLAAQQYGLCPNPPKIFNAILNITNNLWGKNFDNTAEIVRCTTEKFYSENPASPFILWITSTTIVPYTDIEDFRILKNLVRNSINNSAMECATQLKEIAALESNNETYFSTFSHFVSSSITTIIGSVQAPFTYFLDSDHAYEEL